MAVGDVGLDVGWDFDVIYLKRKMKLTTFIMWNDVLTIFFH